MVLAAARGERGCKILAFSNWLRHRLDELGRGLFLPFDVVEHR